MTAHEPHSKLSRAAARLLNAIGARGPQRLAERDGEAASELQSADLAARRQDGLMAITDAGRARLRREAASAAKDVSAFRAQHMAMEMRDVAVDGQMQALLADGNESPLAWLARRKGRDGRAMITPAQFVAGERLRADFTRAQMTPRVTANWDSPMRGGGRGGGAARDGITDLAIAARQRLRAALDAAGPEFAGPLFDVCCFLQGLEDVERARGWPPRSAKVVLQLGLDRLARHYGLAAHVQGYARADIATWLAPDATFTT